MVKRILLCQFVDGETKLTHEAIALLLGVQVDHMLERWDPRTGLDRLPSEWKRRAEKRARTARDAMGTDAGTVGVAYWAAVTWPNCRIDHDDAAGQMWAVVDE